MFDANKGNQAVADQVDTKSDDFAARFADLDPRTELRLLERLNELLDSPEDLQQFIGGANASSTSRPAGALGSGASGNGGPEDTEEFKALETLKRSTELDPGIKIGLERMLNPKDPDPLIMDSRGVPEDLVSANDEIATLKREKANLEQKLANAEQALADEQDDRKPDSLAGKLAKAHADLRTAEAAAGGLNDDQREALRKGREAWGTATDPTMGSGRKVKKGAANDLDRMFEALPS